MCAVGEMKLDSYEGKISVQGGGRVVVPYSDVEGVQNPTDEGWNTCSTHHYLPTG